MIRDLRKTFVLFILLTIIVCALLYFNNSTLIFANLPRSIILDNYCEYKKEYKRQCLDLFFELNNPDPSKFYRPPLAKVPDELYNEFTQNGDMPFYKDFYFNDVYSDADKKISEKVDIISKDTVDHYRLNSNNTRVPNYYGDWENHKLMPKYNNYIKGKIMTIIGTIAPWLEAIALDAGAGKVVTLGK